MTIQLPQIGTLPERFGFRDGLKGTQTSRTIMLSELRTLLAAIPISASKSDYRSAIIDENLLGKKTASTRRLTAQRMRELYALDPDVLLFRILRQLWEYDDSGRSLLACLCANARDPILRMTSLAIIPVNVGEVVTTEQITDILTMQTDTRFNPATRHRIARNAASSWMQSGHIAGRNHKVRSQTEATPASAAYALLLGYLAGVRGELLFDTYWTRLLDVSPSRVDMLAFEASRRGWIDYKRMGAVVEIAFTGLLSAAEMEAIREQD